MLHYVVVKVCALIVILLKQNFFAACNCVYAHAKHLDEIIHVSLQESYCLPILIYASAAVRYSVKQVDEMNACWNSVFRRIFGFNKYESVNGFICGLGRLDLRHTFRIRRFKFYGHNYVMYQSSPAE